MNKIKIALLFIGLLIYFTGGLYLIGCFTDSLKHLK